MAYRIKQRIAKHNKELAKGEQIAPVELMSYEEFRNTPQALDGFVYPTDEELQQAFDAPLKALFEAIEETAGDNGTVALNEPRSGYRKRGERADNRQLSLDFTGSYTTSEGKNVRYSSARGSEALLEDNPTRKEVGAGLDKAAGEFALVERIFIENGQYGFMSGERIESAADVAYIFSALEDAGKEHSFAVFVKEGKPTVVELGMGTFNSTMVDMATVSLAYSRLHPDEIYFVHNHPSGNLECSPQDIRCLQMFEAVSKVPVHGVIINLKSGKYGTFGNKRSLGEGVKRTPERSAPLTVHTLDKQIFARDYDPMSQPRVRCSADVAAFLNSHRMGDRAKVSVLIVSQGGRIVGNIHTPFSEISTDIEEKARYISEKVIRFGGASAIVYGDFATTDSASEDYMALKEWLEKLGSVNLNDVIKVEGNYTRSAADNRELREPGSEYGGGDVRFRMGESGRSFAERQRAAVANRGTVMPGLKEAAVKVVDVPRHGYHGHDILSQAVDAASKRYAGQVLTYDNYGAQFQYVIKPRALKYAANHSGKSSSIGVHAAVMDRLSDVIGESIEIMEHADVWKRDGNRSEENGYNPDSLMHRFVGAVNVEGIVYRVVTTLKEYSNEKMPLAHTYEVTKIEVLDAKTPSTPNATTNNEQSMLGIAKLLQGAEIHKKTGEKILEESAKSSDGHGDAKASELEQMGAELASRLHTPVRFITDENEISNRDKGVERKMRGAKGWYDTGTGEVVIVLPNNATVEDVAETVFHEVVAHKGLRELVGEENYDAFCDEVYTHLKDELKQRVDEEATRRFISDPSKGYAYHRRVAVDEMFGRLSEKGFEDFTKAERGIWVKLKAKVLDAINKFLGSLKLPKWVTLGDNELRYMLWRSHERLTAKSDYVGMARDAAKRAELKVGTDVAMRQDASGHKKMSGTNEARLNDLDPADAEHGAKVAKRIETAKSKLKRLAEIYRTVTNPKGFLTDLGHSLGAIVGKSGSGYRTFELENGSIVKVRISTHNVNSENANASEPVVSIVIKPKRTPNTFVGEPGKEVSEFVYFKEELRKAPAGTLSKIAEGLSEMLDTGAYKDKTGLARENHSGEKALEWLTRREPHAHKYTVQELDDGAKLIKNFENPATETRESDLRFRQASDYVERERVVAKSLYEESVSKVGYKLTEAYADSMLGLKRFYEAVEAGSGERRRVEDIPSFENAYTSENSLSSLNLSEQDAYERLVIQPLLDAVARLAPGAVERMELTDYMLAKHGLERNAYMRQEAAKNNERTDRDFAGLCGLTKLTGWQAAEAEAQRMVDEYERVTVWIPVAVDVVKM